MRLTTCKPGTKVNLTTCKSPNQAMARTATPSQMRELLMDAQREQSLLPATPAYPRPSQWLQERTTGGGQVMSTAGTGPEAGSSAGTHNLEAGSSGHEVGLSGHEAGFLGAEAGPSGDEPGSLGDLLRQLDDQRAASAAAQVQSHF